MPELPEVESLRRDLAPTVVGRTIVSVDLRLPKLFRPAPGLSVEDLNGRRVEGLRRRAKLLVWDLSDGLALVTHLKLTGQLVHLDAEGHELAHGGHPVPRWGATLPHKATHVLFHLDDGSLLYLTDIRQFARLWLMPEGDVGGFLKSQKLGPEPLSRAFSADDLRARLSRRSVPIKTVLLDQKVIGGVGNIYADESLWRARIHPRRPADSLSEEEVKRLHQAIKRVLRFAVTDGVASVHNGVASLDRAFPHAHGRAGTPCQRCRRVIVKEWVGGRGTHWCPGCQPEPAVA